jgi:acetyltransferase-like isoleucine patch superfamily enzyme
MVKRMLREVKRAIWQSPRDSRKQICRSVHPSAILTIHKDIIYAGGRIVVGEGSSLVIEEGVKINADLLIGQACAVSIGKNSVLQNVTFHIRNHSVVETGEGVIFDSPERYPTSVTVDNGTLLLCDKVHIQASEIYFRFGGKMTVGKYTGMGYGTEIRCEEQIDIGAYGMISYDVCIYDTNAHSTDWRERRERIEKGYPFGAGEERRPGTKPIRIGDDVWIGKATIMKGCVIGNRRIVGIRTAVGG